MPREEDQLIYQINEIRTALLGNSFNEGFIKRHDREIKELRSSFESRIITLEEFKKNIKENSIKNKALKAGILLGIGIGGGATLASKWDLIKSFFSII